MSTGKQAVNADVFLFPEVEAEAEDFTSFPERERKFLFCWYIGS